MDISNKTLMWLLILAIVVSLWGTMTSLSKLRTITITGAATNTSSAIANLSVSQNIGIIFSVDQAQWGSGYVNQSIASNCSLTNNGSNSAACANFNVVNTPLVIENVGNVNFTTVYLKSDKDPATFLSGASFSNFTWLIAFNESNSCSALYDTTWTVVNSSPTGYGSVICDNFNFLDDRDSIKVLLNVSFSYDINPGTHTATLTVTGVV